MSKLIVLMFLVLVALAWAPWLSQTKAVSIIQAAAEKEENNSLNNEKCSIMLDPTSVHETFFGYAGTVSYNCNIENFGTFNQGQDTVLVTPFENIVGMPSRSEE